MKTKSDNTVENIRSRIQDFLDLFNTENDMSRVIVSVSYLDTCLSALLKGFLIKSKVTEKALSHRGMMGSLVSKADSAYILGLIPKEIYQDILLLADIRNHVAHEHIPKDFSDDEFLEECNKLKYIGTLKNGDLDELAFTHERLPHPKDRFNCTILTISQFILKKSENIERLKRT